MAMIKLFLVSFLTLLSLISDILAPKNVALNKSTNQSSIYISSNSNNGDSYRAVDGNTNSYYGHRSCTRTNDAYTSWWCVDLDREIRVNNTKIYNRDSNRERLQGFDIRLSSDGKCDQSGFNTATMCYKDPTTSPQDIYTVDSCNQPTSTLFTARSVYISVSRENDKAILTLCEVEIFEDCKYCFDGKCGTAGVCPLCINNRHGNYCDNTCRSSCTGGCAQSNGICNGCNFGFYGDYCDNRCSGGCNPGGCSKTGVCNNGCKEGYWGGGGGCNLKCPNCQPAGCRMADGVCNYGCQEGWHGNKCDRRCNQRCTGGCVKSSGICNGCYSGSYGNYCGNSCNSVCRGGCLQSSGVCNECSYGFYGNYCGKRCSDGCEKQCSQQDGTCSCKSKYYDSKCSSVCSTKCKGGLCVSSSRSPSQPNCTSGCVSGYKGSYCQTSCPANCLVCDASSCSSCKTGWYGNNCLGECSINCDGGCTISDGKCNQCKSGTVGDFCNSTCGDGCLPAGCHRNGTCTSGCIEGRFGDKCDMNCSLTCVGECARYTSTCTQCINGYYGDTCQYNCSMNCIGVICTDGGKCTSGCIGGKSGSSCDSECRQHCTVCKQDDINSCSECTDGRFGESCNKTCSSNCKPDQVGTKPVCNITSGMCSRGCQVGFYGDDCNINCNPFCLDDLCDQMTGLCSNGCNPGKIGTNCTEDCSSGLYGFNCTNKCGNCANSNPCDTASGSCDPFGCQDGFEGTTCDSVVPVTPDITTIIASVVAVILVIIIVVIVLVVMFIRRRRQSGKKVTTNNNSMPLSRHVGENIQPEGPDHHYSTLTKRVDNTEAVYTSVSGNDVKLYHNVAVLPTSPTCVDLVDLWDYIQGKKEKKEFNAEYQKLPKGFCRPHAVCLNEFNKMKNRYNGICAFDETRVKLELQDGDPNSDYINACYITTYGTADNKYIASQGPIDMNINEFIRMFWDVDASKIVMVTNICENNVVKCVKYWPEVGQSTKTGKISIQLIKQDVFSNFTIRELNIMKDGCNSRIVKQYHYTSWPDKGVPADVTSLLEFRNEVERSTAQRSGPMIVHCSAGIGRTGTFLALDYLINEGQSEHSVDVFRCVSQMRRERVNMVQTQVEYIFLHDALAEWYLTADTMSTATEYQQVYQQMKQVNTQTGKSGLQDKYEMMNKMSQRTDDKNYSDAQLPQNINKNRDWNILASNTSRPYFQIIDHSSTDYINAVNLPSYKKKDGYILTQTPLPNTVVDFWTLVVQSEATVIINLEHTATSRKDVGEYLPQRNVVNCGPYTITKTTDEKHKSGLFTVITCHITSDLKEDVDNTVRIYQCSLWTDEQKSPQSSHVIFCLLEEINSWTKTKDAGSIVVHCLNGSDKGGLFCVLAAILERLAVGQDFCVLQKILQFRVQRPQIITCFEQFKFCFDAVGEYIDNFST